MAPSFSSDLKPEVSANEETEPFKPGEPYRFAPKSDGRHWQKCFAAVEKYDNDMCSALNGEIDTLLVFAGLFTAIVTAFSIDSYKWLQPESTDLMAAALYAISLQLSNSSVPATRPDDLPFSPSDSAVRINCFWFLSITLSLSSALLGIIGKQWLRAFQEDAALPPDRALALRQLRFDGLQYWGVRQIVAVTAVLLQVALFLFLAGILDLLWDRNRKVAICASVVVGLLSLVMVLTTTLPAISYISSIHRTSDKASAAPCPYKSPQSCLVLQVARNFDKLSRAHYRSFRRFFRFGDKRLLLSKLKEAWTSFFKLETKQGWLALGESLLLRSFPRVCGRIQPLETGPLVEEAFRLKALFWIRVHIGFSSDTQVRLFQCLREAKIDCHAKKGVAHLIVPETRVQCDHDSVSVHAQVRNLLTFPEHPLSHLELDLRIITEDTSSARVYDAMFNVVGRLLTSYDETPGDLLQLIISSLDTLLNSGRLRPTHTEDFWRLVFLVYMRHSDANDARFGEILSTFENWLAKYDDDKRTILRSIARTAIRDFDSAATFKHIQHKPMWDDFLRLMMILDQFLNGLTGSDVIAFRSLIQDWAEFKQLIVSSGAQVPPDFLHSPNAALLAGSQQVKIEE